MEANSSSFSLIDFHHCLDSKVGISIVTSFLLTKLLLLLPLSILVLYLGLQRWRQQCSVATTCHSDIFTYHSAAMELVYMLGTTFNFCGKYLGLLGVMTVGYYLCSCALPGQTSLHVLTCVERYLAVIHPIIYLRLRQSGGVRIRNFSIGCVWLLCIGWIGLTALYSPNTPYIPFFCILLLFLFVVSFCSIPVLCVLIRPGAGETGGNRRRVDQSKQRAFATIMAITGVLWLFFIGFIVCAALDNSHVISVSVGCVVLMSGYWLAVPSSLVLPLLFLHRAGKLLCCHSSSE